MTNFVALSPSLVKQLTIIDERVVSVPAIDTLDW